MKNDISDEAQSKILDVLRNTVDSLDAMILEDYNKGVIVQKLIPELVALARSKGKIVAQV